MRFNLRFLRIPGVATPSKTAHMPSCVSVASTVTNDSDATVDSTWSEIVYPETLKQLQWDQQKLKDELYHSIFSGLREDNNVALDETTPVTASTTDATPKSNRLSFKGLLKPFSIVSKRPNIDAASNEVVRRSTDAPLRNIVKLVTVASIPEEIIRKTSDKTIISEISTTSDNTVYRRPSRHISFVIGATEPDIPERRALLISKGPDPVPTTIDPRRYPLTAYSSWGSDSVPPSIPREYDDAPLGLDDSPPDSPRKPDLDRPVFDSSDYIPPAVSSLPEYALPQRLFSDTNLQSRQEKALEAFNVLAKEHGCYTLIKPENDPINFQNFIRPKASFKEALLRKVRSVGSHICHPVRGRGVPTLRRVKTFKNLSKKYKSMDSLKGKTLEKLGVLGGYSAFSLPGDLAPAVMRLPAFLVMLICYLASHGPLARNIFYEPGDPDLANAIYDHFADQLLELEKENDLDDLFARRNNFTSGNDNDLESFGFEERVLHGRFHVLPVAWVFKHVLKGIPGGILGSPRLYHTLVDLTYRKFLDEPNYPQFGHNGSLPVVSPTRARAISLAILTLTSDMQFDFLCAIFGLCSLFEYETTRLVNFYRAKKSPPINRATLFDRHRIIEVFTPLLAEETKDVGPEDAGCEAYCVMEMMLDCWRLVSRQLQASDV